MGNSGGDSGSERAFPPSWSRSRHLFRLRHRFSLVSATLGLLGLTVLSACLAAGPGACSADERAAFEAIQHFGDRGLEAEDHATGACAARFEATDPQAVIDHYTASLQAAGWEVGARGTQPDGTPVVDPPGILSARKGEMSFSVEIPLEGADQGTVTVLVGEGL